MRGKRTGRHVLAAGALSMPTVVYEQVTTSEAVQANQPFDSSYNTTTNGFAA